MSTMTLVHRAVGAAHLIPAQVRTFLQPRDQRGLSQSTEQALLVAAAIIVAGAIGLGVWNFVQSKLAGGGVTITGGP